MKKKDSFKTYILTEGSKKIGTGHITRCLSLYDEIKKQKGNPTFLLNGDSTVTKLFKGKEVIYSNWLLQKNREKYLKKADCVIIDSYLASAPLYKSISKCTKVIFIIDDYLKNRISYPSGIILKTASLPNKKINIKATANENVILKSEKYLLLRKDFLGNKIIKVHSKVKTFFITFGGDDLRNLTPHVLKLLNTLYPQLKKIVVIGPSFNSQTRKDIRAAADARTILIENATAFEMRQAMLKSDIAISAGGQTINELAYLGLPTITVCVTDNQKEHIQKWLQRGFIQYAGSWKDSRPVLLTNLKKQIDFLKNKKVREKINKKGKKIIDGQGMHRAIQVILSKLEND